MKPDKGLMRLLGIALVLVFTALSCTSTDTPLAEMERSTYLTDDGRIYFETDCPGARSLIIGGYEAADGLPKKGQTDLERVESMLGDARAGFLIGPNAVEVNLIHRNGEVWDGPGNGVYTVERVDDHQYEILLSTSGTCPTNPVSWHGVPLLYNRTSSTTATAPLLEGMVIIPDLVGLTVAEARGLIGDAGLPLQGSQGTELADDGVIRDQIPGPGATLPKGSIVQVDT